MTPQDFWTNLYGPNSHAPLASRLDVDVGRGRVDWKRSRFDEDFQHLSGNGCRYEGAVDGVTLWPLGVYFVAVLVVVVGQIGLSYFLGERHEARAKGEPYESGIVATGTARVRFSAHFYLVAMFFVIFDLEAVFLFAWAVAVPELGWLGFAEVLVFVGVLIAAWAYLWRIGALDWGPKPRLGRSASS